MKSFPLQFNRTQRDVVRLGSLAKTQHINLSNISLFFKSLENQCVAVVFYLEHRGPLVVEFSLPQAN